MRVWVVALVIGCSTGNPVEDCPNFPESDCCSENAECFEFYGSDFPYCSKPNRPDGGTCSECAENKHCSDDQFCDLDGVGFGVCLDR